MNMLSNECWQLTNQALIDQPLAGCNLTPQQSGVNRDNKAYLHRSLESLFSATRAQQRKRFHDKYIQSHALKALSEKIFSGLQTESAFR